MPLSAELVSEIESYQKAIMERLPFNYFPLERLVLQYFDAHPTDANGTDPLFNELAKTWVLLYYSHQFHEAARFWDLPLAWASQWEQTRSQLLHKGTPYYFKAMAALRGGYLDEAFLLFHRAMEDDKLSNPSDYKKAPAWKFVTLDSTSIAQAARELVTSHANWLETGCIAKYAAGGLGNITLVDLQSKMLDVAGLEETTFSFVYSTFRARWFVGIPGPLKSGSFSAQLAQDILFALCRIGEIWIRHKSKLSGELAAQLKWAFRQASLTAIDSDPIMVGSFHDAIDALLKGEQGPFARTYSPEEANLMVLYRIRNQAGHDVIPEPLLCSQFELVLDTVLKALLFIAEKL